MKYKCELCDFESDNKKSITNHKRFGCHGFIQNKRCEYCGRLLVKRQASKQGKFCDHRCYALWRAENLLGEKAPSYKDGSCSERQLLRASLRYKEWRKAVFKRDKYTCQICGDNKGGNLVADHIRSFALYPELRYDITNGRTLCKKCHEETENYGYTKQNAKRDKV